MAGFFDIYALSRHRDVATIERFWATFCDRPRLELVEDYEIRVASSKKYGLLGVEVLVNSLTELIATGVNNPDYSFAFYNSHSLEPNNIHNLRPDLKSVFLKFTFDGQVIFGLSIDECLVNGKTSYSYASKLACELEILTKAHKTYIAYEYPPADDEEEFDEDVDMWQNLRELQKKIEEK